MSGRRDSSMRLRRWTVPLPMLICALAAGVVLRDWLRDAPPPPPPRLPAAEGSLAESRAALRPRATAAVRSSFTAGVGEPGTTAAAWPGFRGPGRDNLAAPTTALADIWPEGGPPIRWQVEVGDGHAAAAVRAGRVYLLDYDEARGGDALRCLSFSDGREIWRHFYPVRTKRNHGISRTIPAVSERHVVTLGPQCQVLCVEAVSGAFRWGHDLVARYGTQVPLWYAGQCPLIDDGVAVLAPAGPRVLLTGLDCESGVTLWETPNPGGWQMSHSSVMLATFHGVRQYLYAALGGLAGIAADGPERGRLLWQTVAFAPSVVAPSPLPLPGNRLLQSAGYGAGSVLFEVRRTNGTEWCAVEVARYDRRHFACEQQTPILRDGYLYTVLPNDAGDHRQELACMDLRGEVLWTSGPRERFGLGPFLALGAERMLLLDDSGVLTMARASAAGFTRLARAAILTGRDAWGPLAFADGFLLARDDKRLICVDLRDARGTTGPEPH